MKASTAAKYFSKGSLDEVREVAEDINCLDEARIYVPFILARCLLSDPSGERVDMMSKLAERVTDMPEAEKERDQLMAKLRYCSPTRPKLSMTLRICITNSRWTFSEAAYLIGLAVG